MNNIKAGHLVMAFAAVLLLTSIASMLGHVDKVGAIRTIFSSFGTCVFVVMFSEFIN